MSQPSERHRWLDGPLFVEWLYGRFPDLDGHAKDLLSSSDIRRLFDYRHGVCPEAYGIPDRICVALEIHLDEIPDKVWRTSPRRRKVQRRSRNASPWERRRALEMLAEGYFPLEVAREIGVTPRTIERWGKVAA